VSKLKMQIIAATISTIGKGSEQENESKIQISKRRSKAFSLLCLILVFVIQSFKNMTI